MIDKVLRFLGIVAMVTLVALGTAFFASGEWEAWKAVRDARPDLAVVELRGQAMERDARIEAAEAAIVAAQAEIAALRDAHAAALDEIETLRASAVAETARVDAALSERVAYGDAIGIAPFEGDGSLAIAEDADGTRRVTLAETGNWRLLKADQ